MTRIAVTYIDTDPSALVFRGSFVVEVMQSADDEVEWEEAKRQAAARLPSSAEITEGLWLK